MSLQDGTPAHARERSALDLLVRLTQIPTAAGREQGVIEFVQQWAAARADIRIREDRAGNLVLSLAALPRRRPGTRGAARAAKGVPLFITAHLDHPAFVVERVDAPGGWVELSFRGGVNEVFFDHAPITLHASAGRLAATLSRALETESPAGRHYAAELDDGPGRLLELRPGDIGTWAMTGSEIDAAGVLHAPACDDLAAAAAALAALDDLRAARAAGRPIGDVRVLLTRSEEIGFVGAIAACRLKTIPRGARVVALENSRASPEAPIGGGPIVRVGDRLSVFTPWLTGACAARAEQVFGGPAQPTASQTLACAARRPWQRKLMAGGACEASVFCHFGYDATCLCLPLGNYHNMPNLDRLQAGTYDATAHGPPRCEREFIHTADYLALVDLLAALGQHVPAPDQKVFGARLRKMYVDRAYVLSAGAAPSPQRRKAPARRAVTSRGR